MIPASPDPLLGGKYRFEDTHVVSGQTYYYELEDVEYGGATARHGPIIITAPGGFDVAQVFVIGVGMILLFSVVGVLARAVEKKSRSRE